MHKELGLFYQFIYLFIYFDNMILIYYFFYLESGREKSPTLSEKRSKRFQDRPAFTGF